MKKHLLIALPLVSVAAALSTPSMAATSFADDFNSYAYELNWAPPANWSAPLPGAVDLIGETTTSTSFDFLPGNGGYVDLDGSDGVAGTLQTLASFNAGSYTLTFDLAGNQRGDVDKTTEISLGSFNTALTLASGSPFTLYTYSFTTTGGNLTFSDLPGGNGNIGNLLDNVTIAAVPEPASWMLMLAGFGMLGFALRSRRQTVTYSFD